MTVAAIAEPTIAVAIFSLALGAGSTNLGRIVTQTLAIRHGYQPWPPSGFCCAVDRGAG